MDDRIGCRKLWCVGLFPQLIFKERVLVLVAVSSSTSTSKPGVPRKWHAGAIEHGEFAR